MHTFLPLPSFLAYGSITPLILRLALGLTLVYFGYRKTRGTGDSSGSNSKEFGIMEVIVGFFLIIGFLTQLSALLNVIILVIKLVYKVREKKFLSDGINYYLLLLAIALALLFVGPGLWAVDGVL